MRTLLAAYGEGVCTTALELSSAPARVAVLYGRDHPLCQPPNNPNGIVRLKDTLPICLADGIAGEVLVFIFLV
jgi:hypothetical protein